MPTIKNIPRIITQNGYYTAPDGAKMVSVGFTNEGFTPVTIQSQTVLPGITLTFGTEESLNIDLSQYEIVFNIPGADNRIIMTMGIIDNL